jgi:hypothetical protein
MKRIQALVISLLFLITNNIQASFLQGPNPYSFGPQGRSVSDLRNFAKPKNMIRILPNRPVVATSSDGSRLFYTSDGKLALSVAKDGSMSFSLGGLTKNYNSDGEFSGSAKTLRGSGLLQEVRDKEDRLLGYKTLNGDGKVSKTYDKDFNLTATYVYTGQGAKLDYVQNEMTKGRSYYDEYGRNKYDVDFNGYIQKTYLYADVEYTADEKDLTRRTLKTKKTTSNPTKTGLLTSVRDYNHNMFSTENGDVNINPLVYNETFFDLEGKTQYIKNTDGTTVRKFHYKQDDKGNKILDYHLDTLTGNKTFYDEHGTASYTVNDENAVITRYFDGYTVNIMSNGAYAEVTKYDIDGKELYTTLKNIKYYDDGTISEVMDEEGELWQEYHYREESGKKVVDYVITYSNTDFGGETTYTWYEDDKPLYVTTDSNRPTDNNATNIVRTYFWDGDTLRCTFDNQTKVTQWYNMNKELVYESMNERIISKNVYSNGQLVGKWDALEGQTMIYLNERPWIKVKSDYEPKPEMVTGLISHSTEIWNAIAYDNLVIAEAEAEAIAKNLDFNRESFIEEFYKSGKSEVVKVLDGFMAAYGWNNGAVSDLLTNGNLYEVVDNR